MFSEAGIPAGKLGIGLAFYGFTWVGGTGTPSGGATGPCQEYDSAPAVQGNVHFSNIMDNIFKPEYYHWDEDAVAAYLSIDNDGSDKDTFVSYDNEITAARKIEYARNKGIGGVIIYELDCGYRTSMPEGHKDELLQAVKNAKLETINPDKACRPAMAGGIRASYSGGKLTVFSNSSLNNAKAELFEISGRRIMQGKLAGKTAGISNSWILNGLNTKPAAGAYLLSIKTGNSSVTVFLTGR
jgi:hypothetical protein